MDELFLKKAKEVLVNNDIGIGVKAGEVFPDLWGRDALISSLGMSISKDDQLLDLARRSMETIARYQRFNGQLLNKISADEKHICFGEGGCVDTSLWYPISVLNYYYVTNDLDFLKAHLKNVNKAVNFALCLDQNADWLIETNDGADWMDVLLRSGRVLYDNVLLYKALLDANEINKILGKEWRFDFIAEHVKESLNLLFWPTEENIEEIREQYGFSCIHNDAESVLRNQKEDLQYYLADVGHKKYDPRFDSLANILAVFFDVADRAKKKKILNYVKEKKIDEPYPLKALYPPIYRYDPYWNFYFRWHNEPYLQEPGNYHNGGIWPFIGGFYVATLKKEDIPFQNSFDKLIKSCELDNWRFSEWLNSAGEIRGSANQSWSAGMLLYTYYYKL